MHKEKSGEIGQDPSVSSPTSYMLISFDFPFLLWHNCIEKQIGNKPCQHGGPSLLSSLRSFMWALRILP